MPDPTPAPRARRRVPRGEAGAPTGADEVTGTGRTALPPGRAVRARDVDRPTAADLARAEAGLVVVRRRWSPPPE